MLLEREKHRRLLILGQRPIPAVFHHAHDFCAIAAPELKMPADRLADRTEYLPRELLIHYHHHGRVLFGHAS